MQYFGLSERAAAHLEADDVLALGVAARNLDCVVNRLGAAVGEKEPRQAGRADLQQPVQQSNLQHGHPLTTLLHTSGESKITKGRRMHTQCIKGKI